MAANKECLIIVVDVRRFADDDFKQKSVKCAEEIIKDKICTDKKDYVSFLLVGSANTKNEQNALIGQESCQNIVEYPHVQLVSWQLLLNFFKFVNEEEGEDGQWLDALVVAAAMIKKAAETFKFGRQRILLFYDFNYIFQDFENFDSITKGLLNDGIDLIVCSHNIHYIDNAETGLPQAVFKSSRKAGPHELNSQKYALRLVSFCNATLCNLKDVLTTVFKVSNKHPWTWNAKLTMGSKISINIAAIIAMRDENHIKLKKYYGESEEEVKRETKYFLKGSEVTPLPETVIDGYMLGGTPVGYDEALMDKREPYTPGLNIVCFVARDAIPDVYFSGDSQYLVVHQRGNAVSARKLNALVRALRVKERAMIGWRIFSEKYNNPKIVVLFPNQPPVDNQPETLLMLEFAYHVQHHFWDFPALRTSKTVCTDEQLQAVDKLIDSMDLELSLKQDQPRDTRQPDLLPFDELPHIHENNIMDLLERKILINAGDDEAFIDMLQNDLNFVDQFWKLPEPIEEQAKQAANNLKKYFPLEQNSTRREKQTKETSTSAKQEPTTIAEPMSQLDFDSVGEKTPAHDFEKLIRHHVLPLQSRTQRSLKFIGYLKQLKEIILKMLKGDVKQFNYEQLILAFAAQRKRSVEFNCFAQYNTFMNEIRGLAVQRNLKEFWSKVIVKHKLGLLMAPKPTVEEIWRADEFYVVSQWQESNAPIAEMNNEYETFF